MIPTLLYLEPWSDEYSYGVRPSVKSSEGFGPYQQVKAYNRTVVMANVKRVFSGRFATDKIKFFESFIRTHCSLGQGKFIDSVYIDGALLESKTVRLLNGGYSLELNNSTQITTISATLEVFDAFS